jgi:hypothetical protein
LTPNVKKLIFEYSEFKSISDELMESLAKLSSLTELSIETCFFMNTVSEEAILYMIESCPSIRYIDFQFPPEISHKVVDKMIDLAKRRPQEKFTFMCFGDESKLLNNYTEEVENEVKNLTIQIFKNKVPSPTESNGTNESNPRPNSEASDVLMLSMSLNTMQLN